MLSKCGDLVVLLETVGIEELLQPPAPQAMTPSESGSDS